MVNFLRLALALVFQEDLENGSTRLRDTLN